MNLGTSWANQSWEPRWVEDMMEPVKCVGLGHQCHYHAKAMLPQISSVRDI